jgi:hypothetical protein
VDLLVPSPGDRQEMIWHRSRSRRISRNALASGSRAETVLVLGSVIPPSEARFQDSAPWIS